MDVQDKNDPDTFKLPISDKEPFLDRGTVQNGCKRYEKLCRVRDVILSVFVILLLFVPSLFLMLLIVLESPGASPLFRQERTGKDGKPFRMLKFRSMYPDAEERLESLLDQNEMDGPVFKIQNDPRITKIGRLIRRIGVDELPQFINVLRGDMRVVGPRPALPCEVEQYGAYERQRLYVLPGITALWQIHPNRNALRFEEWLELDLEYITKRSLRLDRKIIFLTILAIFRADGE